MNIAAIMKKLKSICAFKKLKKEMNRYVQKEEFLIDENFIFLVYLPATDYYFFPYFQLYNYKNVSVHYSYINSNKYVMGFLKYMPCFIKYRKYTRFKYMKDKQYFFYFDGQYTVADKEFRSFLRKKYFGCKIVFHLGDLIRTKKGIDIKDIKEFADLVVAHDHNDAEENHLIYHSDPYSKLPLALLTSLSQNRTVTFYGQAKNRKKELLGVYDILKKNNINCDFCIPDLNSGDCNYRQELANAQIVPYLEYLRRIQNTDCILEIIQKGSLGCTLRTWEAVVYNKKLVTNNPSVRDEPFYNTNFIQIIESVDSINIDWIKKEIKVDYGYAEQLSPKACFEFYLKCLTNN